MSNNLFTISEISIFICRNHQLPSNAIVESLTIVDDQYEISGFYISSGNDKEEFSYKGSLMENEESTYEEFEDKDYKQSEKPQSDNIVDEVDVDDDRIIMLD